MNNLHRTSSRIKTRFIAVLALITSGVTFGSGLFVFLYMKSPAFEYHLLGRVMKHMDWIIEDKFEKQIRKPKPVLDANDQSKWFWDYIEKRQKEQIEEQMSKFNSL
tara:strand:- start:141 stop:458 length:318 start_codon:yes stop_codon:yes gene_type:complete